MLGRFPEVGCEFQKSSKKGFRSPGSVLLPVEWIFLKARGTLAPTQQIELQPCAFCKVPFRSSGHKD